MGDRKTAGRRLAGYSKSERVDAKVLLLAVAPLLPIIFSDKIGWSRGVMWQAWCWLSIAWAVGVIGINFAAYVRAFRQLSRRKS